MVNLIMCIYNFLIQPMNLSYWHPANSRFQYMTYMENEDKNYIYSDPLDDDILSGRSNKNRLSFFVYLFEYLHIV